MLLLRGAQTVAELRARTARLHAFGTADETDPLRRCAGNQPSSTLVLPRLDPHHLGMLLALYEHKTFVQGVVWGLNPFDQWGVELGKRLARRLLPLIGDAAAECREDASTCGLAAHLHRLRERR